MHATIEKMPKPIKSAKTSKLPKLKYEVVHITPGMAESWLEKNKKNRPIKPKSIAAYARDMASYSWRLVGDPIRFDVNGDLIDGQNRLLACIKADVGFTSLVVYGLDPTDQSVIDSGVARRVADNLALNGFHAATMLAAAIKILHVVKVGGSVYDKPSNSEVMDITRRHPGLSKSCARIWKIRTKGIPRGNLAFIHYVGANILGKIEAADAFVDVFATGIPAYEGCAAHALRERLLSSPDGRKISSLHEKMRSFAHAWNLFVKQEPLQHFRLPKEASIIGLDLEKL